MWYMKSYSGMPFYNYIKYNTKPRPSQTHVRILKYINENDGAKRKDILKALVARKDYSRGQWSTIFQNMIYHGFIKYDSAYRYHITDAGKARLTLAYTDVK